MQSVYAGADRWQLTFVGRKRQMPPQSQSASSALEAPAVQTVSSPSSLNVTHAIAHCALMEYIVSCNSDPGRALMLRNRPGSARSQGDGYQPL